MRYCHKILIRGNRFDILPQFSFVALISHFVAIEATYCHKLYQRRNMVVVLRQLRRVAWISYFVAIETWYCNKVNLHGNIQTYIATILTCGASHRDGCKQLSSYCNKTCIGCNMAAFASTSLCCNNYYILRQIMHSW